MSYCKKLILICFVVLGQLLPLPAKAVGEGSGVGNRNRHAGKENFNKPTCSVERGFVGVVRKNGQLLLDIPYAILGRDLLLGARVVEVSSTANSSKLVAGQMLRNPILVRFAYDGNLVLLQKPNVDQIISSDDPMFEAFQRNNVVPVLQAFDVAGISDSSVVIDVTKFFQEDLPFVEPFSDKARPGKLEPKPSGIIDARAFEKNVEVRVRNHYTTNREPFLAVVQKSLVLLPEEVMRPRLFDERMNYYSDKKKLFSSSQQEVEQVEFIRRFRIEPKPNEEATHRGGQLVEPAKPIVFYVDNSFPQAWNSAIKKGIEDWNKAFEAIGFKNVLVAKDYPADDPDFDPNDMRYNCFKYAITENSNAMGLHWIDPRSGEIIQAEVLYFSNVTKLLHKWRFLQTAAVSPEARSMVLEDSTMQEIIRYSAAHEIGHCLGLTHNFRASFAYPVDSLRSATFTAKYGTTPSIMDYARFNYVAQPGDEGVNLLPPHLGEYDRFSIKVGYQPIYGASTCFDEYRTINRWFVESQDNPVFVHGRRSGMDIATDPARQSGDLGNDHVKASQYGIANLKVIAANLKAWMQPEERNFEYISGLYDDLMRENFNYISNAMANLGGVYTYHRVAGDGQSSAEAVPREEVVRTVDFIVGELKTQHTWLCTTSIKEFAPQSEAALYKYQKRVIENMVSPLVIANLYQFRDLKGMMGVADYLGLIRDRIEYLSRNNPFGQQYVAILRLALEDLKNKEKDSFYSSHLAGVIDHQLRKIK